MGKAKAPAGYALTKSAIDTLRRDHERLRMFVEGRQWGGRRRSLGSGGDPPARFVLTADLAHDQATGTGDITEWDGSEVLKADVTLYNTLISVADRYMFSAPSGSAGICMRRGDGEIVIIQLECLEQELP